MRLICSNKVQTKLLQLVSVMSLSHQVKLQAILGLHKLSQVKLANFTESVQHEVICKQHKIQIKLNVTLYDYEVVRVQVLDYSC